MGERVMEYRPYKPPRDREKEELKKKLEQLEAELARKEVEIEYLRKERGRIPELEREIQKLTSDISEIKESLKKAERTKAQSLDERIMAELQKWRKEVDEIKKDFEFGDPPIWALLEPGTYFNYDYKSIDIEGSINWEVLSKEHDRVRIQYTSNSTGDAIKVNGTYVTPWLKRVETTLIDKNGYILEIDVHGSSSATRDFSNRAIYSPGELKTYLWINPNEINMGDTIKNDNFGSLVVESTKMFGGRNCFYLKRQSKVEDVGDCILSAFYDKSTGLFIGSTYQSPVIKSKTQLTSTNARI